LSFRKPSYDRAQHSRLAKISDGLISALSDGGPVDWLACFHPCQDPTKLIQLSTLPATKLAKLDVIGLNTANRL
jgi:hypothetical protein